MRAAALLALLAAAGPARALDPGPLDLMLRVRAAPEGSWENRESPWAPTAGIAGIGAERGRGELELRLRQGGLTLDASGRLTAFRGDRPASVGTLNELYDDVDVAGQHLSLGKKVLAWDVGFGFRPLDVVQQENRRSLLPYALEGVPLLAWELFGESSAWTLVYANPLRGRAPSPRDDESAALRHYRRLGSVDLHLVSRFSRRTQAQAGVGLAAVVGEAVELHGSALYQRRSERPRDARLEPGAPILAAGDPAVVRVSPDVVAALAGMTVTPGWDLSFLAEAWVDPTAPSPAEWRDMARLARAQGALLGSPQVPAGAVVGNLAYGARFLDRPNLSRRSLLVRASQKWDRLEPAVEVLVGPEDGSLVATATVGYDGERSHLAAGVRVFGGRRDSPARLLPTGGSCYASWELRF